MCGIVLTGLVVEEVANRAIRHLRDAATCAFSSFEKVGSDVQVPRHVVHLWDDPETIGPEVARWLAPAIRDGGAILLLGRPANIARIRRVLENEVEVGPAESEGRIRVLFADDLTARFIIGDRVDAQAMIDAFRHMLEGVRGEKAERPVRVWGELADLVRRSGRVDDARTIEVVCEAVVRHDPGLGILCSYDVRAAPIDDVDGACRGHSTALPLARALAPLQRVVDAALAR